MGRVRLELGSAVPPDEHQRTEEILQAARTGLFPTTKHTLQHIQHRGQDVRGSQRHQSRQDGKALWSRQG